MPEITATEAARHFSDLLDSVEYRGEAFTVVRHGKAVAHIEPIPRANGAEVKAFLTRHRPDPDWMDDIKGVRELLEFDA